MEENKIHFEKTWCDYLTPCPFRNKEQDPAGVFVGDWDCHGCPYHVITYDVEQVVVCNCVNPITDTGVI